MSNHNDEIIDLSFIDKKALEEFAKHIIQAPPKKKDDALWEISDIIVDKIEGVSFYTAAPDITIEEVQGICTIQISDDVCNIERYQSDLQRLKNIIVNNVTSKDFSVYEAVNIKCNPRESVAAVFQDQLSIDLVLSEKHHQLMFFISCGQNYHMNKWIKSHVQLFKNIIYSNEKIKKQLKEANLNIDNLDDTWEVQFVVGDYLKRYNLRKRSDSKAEKHDKTDMCFEKDDVMSDIEEKLKSTWGCWGEQEEIKSIIKDLNAKVLYWHDEDIQSVIRSPEFMVCLVVLVGAFKFGAADIDKESDEYKQFTRYDLRYMLEETIVAYLYFFRGYSFTKEQQSKILHTYPGIIKEVMSRGFSILDQYFKKYPLMENGKVDPRYVGGLTWEAVDVKHVTKEELLGSSKEKRLKRLFRGEELGGEREKTFLDYVKREYFIKGRMKVENIKTLPYVQFLKEEKCVQLDISGSQMTLRKIIPLRCSQSHPKKQRELSAVEQENLLMPLSDSVDKFLLTDNQEMLLLLGEAGVGKSRFIKACFDKYWTEYILGETQRIPVFINFRAVKDISNKKVFLDFIWRNVLGRDDEVNVEKLYELPFAFFFDAYDEKKCQDFNVQEVLLKDFKDAKSVVACRTTYAEKDARFIDRFFRFCELLYVHPFDDDQIGDYVRQYIKESTDEMSPFDAEKDVLWTEKEYLEEMASNSSLKELVKNPFLLEKALKVLPVLALADIGEDKSEKIRTVSKYTAGCILEKFMSRIFDSEQKRGKGLVNGKIAKNLKTHSVSLCGNLAYFMYKNKLGEVGLADLPGKKTWASPFYGGDKISDMIVAACLFSKSDDKYWFTHNLHKEFFVAHKLYKEFARIKFENMSEETIQKLNLSEVLLSQDIEILQFFVDLLLGKDRECKKLLQIIELSKKLPYDDEVTNEDDKEKIQRLKVAASNAISILVMAGYNFSGKDLRNIKVPGANLRGGRFNKANLEGAEFTDVDIRGANFGGANLRNIRGEGIVTDMVFSRPFDEENNSKRFTDIVLRKEHDLIVSSCEKKLLIWNISDGSRCEIEAHEEFVRGVVLSHDSTLMASFSNKEVKIWSIKGELLHTIPIDIDDFWYGYEDDIFAKHLTRTFMVSSVAFTSDNKTLMVSIGEQNVAVLCYYEIDMLDQEFGYLNGRRVIKVQWDFEFRPPSMSQDGTTIVIDEDYSKHSVQVISPDGRKQILKLSEDDLCIRAAIISPNGKYIAYSCYRSSKLHLYDVESNTRVCLDEKAFYKIVFPIQFSKDSKRLVSVTNEVVDLWDVESGKKINTDTVVNLFQLRGMTFSEDLGFCAYMSGQKQVEVVALWGKKYEIENDVLDPANVRFIDSGKRIIAYSSSLTILGCEGATETEIPLVRENEGGVNTALNRMGIKYCFNEEAYDCIDVIGMFDVLFFASDDSKHLIFSIGPEKEGAGELIKALLVIGHDGKVREFGDSVIVHISDSKPLPIAELKEKIVSLVEKQLKECIAREFKVDWLLDEYPQYSMSLINGHANAVTSVYYGESSAFVIDIDKNIQIVDLLDDSKQGEFIKVSQAIYCINADDNENTIFVSYEDASIGVWNRDINGNFQEADKLYLECMAASISCHGDKFVVGMVDGSIECWEKDNAKWGLSWNYIPKCRNTVLKGADFTGAYISPECERFVIRQGGKLNQVFHRAKKAYRVGSFAAKKLVDIEIEFAKSSYKKTVEIFDKHAPESVKSKVESVVDAVKEVDVKEVKEKADKAYNYVASSISKVWNGWGASSGDKENNNNMDGPQQ